MNHDGLLKGLLFCGLCGSAMTPTYSVKGARRYRYYRCLSTIKQGAHACPTGAVPALGLERQVLERIREIARDPVLVAEVVRQARVRVEERRQVPRRKQRRLKSSPSPKAPRIRESDVAAALAQFDGVWDALLPRERSRVFALLVGRVDYGGRKQIEIRFRVSKGANER